MHWFCVSINRGYPTAWVMLSLIFGGALQLSQGSVTSLSATYDQYFGFLAINLSGPLSSQYAKACTSICLLFSIAQAFTLLMLSGDDFRGVARFSNAMQLNGAIAIGAVCFVILFFFKTIENITLVHSLGWLAAPLLVPIATSIPPLLIGLLAYRFGYYNE